MKKKKKQSDSLCANKQIVQGKHDWWKVNRALCVEIVSFLNKRIVCV